jgi:hypothetical protein
MKTTVLLLGLLAGWAAVGAEASASFRLDNRSPGALVLRTGESLDVQLSADWAGEDAAFSVNGEEVRTISSGAETYRYLFGDFGRWAFVKLEFVSGGLRYERTVQVLNGEAVDSGSLGTFALDSRTGQVRRAKRTENIAYSSLWNEGASLPVISENGSSVFTAEAGSGDFIWSLRGRKAGRYVLTHNDGVETMSAIFNYAPPGTSLLLR